MCVVAVLWPIKQFRLHSFSLFRVMEYSLSGIGESIGSHLATTYSAYSGLNYTLAGVSIDSAMKLGNRDWAEICLQYKDVLDYAQQTIQDHQQDFVNRRQVVEVCELNCYLLCCCADNPDQQQLEIAKLYRQLDGVKQHLDTMTAKVTSDTELHEILQQARKRYTILRSVISSNEAETKRLYDHLVNLARDFGLSPVLPIHQTQYASHYHGSSEPSSES